MTESDNRRVVLLKSTRTKNRFYTLATEESGFKNATEVPDFGTDLVLGIAYPCLEDGLNDFAVIRTTYETIDQFGDDLELRNEMMSIVLDARENLDVRLAELRNRLESGQAYFLGTNLDEFKGYSLSLTDKGVPRRNLDSMMKLNIFSSVAEYEAERMGRPPEPGFRYEWNNNAPVESLRQMSPREFVVALFDDVLESVRDDDNYASKYSFDRFVFQKFVAMMFVNYATTDPIFYGTSKADYEVSADKDMDKTPLYIAVGRALREIEARRRQGGPDITDTQVMGQEPPAPPRDVIELPREMVNEDALLALIGSLAHTGRHASQFCAAQGSPVDYGKLVLSDARKLVNELKRLGLISDLAADPTQN